MTQADKAERLYNLFVSVVEEHISVLEDERIDEAPYTEDVDERIAHFRAALQGARATSSKGGSECSHAWLSVSA